MCTYDGHHFGGGMECCSGFLFEPGAPDASMACPLCNTAEFLAETREAAETMGLTRVGGRCFSGVDLWSMGLEIALELNRPAAVMAMHDLLPFEAMYGARPVKLTGLALLAGPFDFEGFFGSVLGHLLTVLGFDKEEAQAVALEGMGLARGGVVRLPYRVHYAGELGPERVAPYQTVSPERDEP